MPDAARPLAALAKVLAAIALSLGVLGFARAAMGGDFEILVLFGFAWLFGVLALVAWSLAVVAAGLGRGALPRWSIAVGGFLFALAAIVSALSFAATSEKPIVGSAFVATLAGLAGAFAAWRRTPPPRAAPGGERGQSVD